MENSYIYTVFRSKCPRLYLTDFVLSLINLLSRYLPYHPHSAPFMVSRWDFANSKSTWGWISKNLAREQSEGFLVPRDGINSAKQLRIGFLRREKIHSGEFPILERQKQQPEFFLLEKENFLGVMRFWVHSKAPNSWINSRKGSSSQVREARFHKRESGLSRISQLTIDAAVWKQLLKRRSLNFLIFLTHVRENAPTILRN